MNDGIGKYFICPITQESIINSVIINDGFTYEKDAIKKWISKKGTSPMTNITLEEKKILKNKSMQFFILSYNYLTNCMLSKKRTKKKYIEKLEENKEISKELKNKFDFALDSYYKSTLDLDQCCKSMKEVYMLAPLNFEITLNYANILRFSGQFQEALELIKKLRRFRPYSQIPNFMKLRIYSEMKKKDKAISKMEKINSEIRIIDYPIVELRYMSYSLVSIGNRTLAEIYIMAYLLIMPEDPRALSHLIYLYSLREKNEKVICLSKEYLERWKDDISILNNQAKAYSLIGEKEKAIEQYLYIASLSKDKNVIAKAYYDCSQNRDKEKDFQAIVEDLEKSYNADPEECADEYLASLYAGKKDFKNADKWLKNVEKRSDINKDPYCLEIKARILISESKYEEAIQAFITLAGIDSRNMVYYNAQIDKIFILQEASNLSIQDDKKPNKK